MSTISIDFDGTLADYTGWHGHSAPLDPPVEGAIQAIRDYQDAGFEIVIHTTRADSTKSIMRIYDWLMAHGLERGRSEQIKITNFKPPAILYLDDRAFCFKGKFPSVEEIKSFRTWQGM